MSLKKTVDKELKYLYYDKTSPVAFTGKNAVIPVLFENLKNKNVQFKNKKIVLALIDDWFSQNRAHAVHKTQKKKFKRSNVIVKGIMSQLQMDLVDMQSFVKENKGYRYILTLIDVFSKKAWAFPIKDKGGQEVRRTLEKFFKSLEKLPEKIQSDKGQEFRNKLVQALFDKNNIEHFSTENQETKAQVVERFQGTLQKALYKMFSVHGNHNWIEHLDAVMNGYNSRYHSSIGMKPNQVTPENEINVVTWMNCKNPPTARVKKHFKKGQIVLIAKASRTFTKGYKAQWTEELFKIHRIKNTTPVTYIVKDMDGDIIEGSFYGEELQLIKTRKKRTI